MSIPVVPDEMVACPLLKRKIADGYCWELCNIGTDEILLYGDKIEDWDEAKRICDKCGYWANDGF